MMTNRIGRALWYIGIPVLLMPGTHAAQDPPPASPVIVPADSTPRAAFAHGRAAAGQPGMGGRFLDGFVAGALGGLIGTVVAHSVVSSKDPTLPEGQLERIARADVTYQRTFEAAYRERIQSRRESAVLKGGLLGTAVIGTIIVIALSD